MSDWSKISKTKESMPEYIRKALVESKVMNLYRERPPYQQNDYLAWIKRAKRDETKMKRMNQMISELRKGDVYMKMDWSGGQ